MTLDLLIDNNLRFVILAPNQAEAYKLPGSNEWHSAAHSIDTSRAYKYSHQDGSGRSMAVFFYNGPVARAIAFEKTLISSQALVELFKQAAERGPLVNVATDGETYGHHFKFGDLSLAHALEIEAPEAGFSITNYGEFLDQHPAEVEVQIRQTADGEGTSWSCAHGVARWDRDCGCYTGGQPGWNQKWRGPLRSALNFLRGEAAREFEAVGGDLLVDPWKARNDSIVLILDRHHSRQDFLQQHASRNLSETDQVRALTLLEMQRNSLLMFTSCGWFFSDISGIETIQVMKYAARLINLLDDLGLPTRRKKFLDILSEAKSNREEMGSGADIYLRHA